jgi:hypothetical protein
VKGHASFILCSPQSHRGLFPAFSAILLWVEIRGMLYSTMRLTAVVLAAGSANAFAPPASGLPGVSAVAPPASSLPSRTALLQLSAVEPATTDCGCAENGSVQMNGVAVSGSTLRSTVLADVNGVRTPVSQLIGEDGKAVVVFLRHLG